MRSHIQQSIPFFDKSSKREYVLRWPCTWSFDDFSDVSISRVNYQIDIGVNGVYELLLIVDFVV